MDPTAISLFLGYFLALYPSSSTPATEDLLWCQVAKESASPKALSCSIYRHPNLHPLPASKLALLWNPSTLGQPHPHPQPMVHFPAALFKKI